MASFLAAGITSVLGSVAAATRGWGQGQITWFSLEKAKERAAREGKPIMLVVHKKKCDACTDMDDWLAYNQEVKVRSRGIIMVHMDVDDAPEGYDKGFLPGRRYFPRTLFFDPSGKPIKHIGSDLKFQYSYVQEQNILGNMDKVKNMFNML